MKHRIAKKILKQYIYYSDFAKDRTIEHTLSVSETERAICLMKGYGSKGRTTGNHNNYSLLKAYDAEGRKGRRLAKSFKHVLFSNHKI